MTCETREKVIGHIQQSKEDWWDCLFCEMQHRGFPYDCPNKIHRADGRVERLCSHGVGHTVFIPVHGSITKAEEDAWWMHGCCIQNCCKDYRRRRMK